MKKVSLILVLIFSVSFVFAESSEVKKMLAEIDGQWKLDENKNITYQRIVEVPGMKKEEIYNKALSYFVYNYGSGKSVIQTQDKDAGLIVAKGIYSNIYVGTVFISGISMSTWHIIRVDVKDGKARITLSLTQYDQVVTGGSTPPSYNSFEINKVFPVTDKGAFKNSYGKAFYASHKGAIASLDAIEKSIKEGNTSKDIEKNNW